MNIQIYFSLKIHQTDIAAPTQQTFCLLCGVQIDLLVHIPDHKYKTVQATTFIWVYFMQMIRQILTMKTLPKCFKQVNKLWRWNGAILTMIYFIKYYCGCFGKIWIKKFIYVIFYKGGKGGRVNTITISRGCITTSCITPRLTTTPRSFTTTITTTPRTSSSITNIRISPTPNTVAVPSPWEPVPVMDPPGPIYSFTTSPQNLPDADPATSLNQFGNVLFTRVYIDCHTVNSKGFGFVLYDYVVSAKHAINQMNGFQISSKRLKVKKKRVHQNLFGGRRRRCFWWKMRGGA